MAYTKDQLKETTYEQKARHMQIVLTDVVLDVWRC